MSSNLTFPTYGASPQLPPTRSARLTLRAVVTGFSALLLWAAFSKIDQVTRAPGQLIASKRTQLVQAPDGGVIKTLSVQEGNKVVQGDLLAVLEQSRVQALNNDTDAKIAALRITLARLEAEVSGSPLRFDGELAQHAEYVRSQTQLFRRRKQAIDEDIAVLNSSLDLVNQELQMNEALLAVGDVSRVDVLRLRRQASEIRGQIISRKNRYLQEAQAEMTRSREELDSQMEALRDRRQQLSQTELRAPADGIVKNVLVNTVGGVIRPGEVLAEIVPSDSALIAEVKVSPADIAFVRVGQSATISVDAYDPAIFGYLPGVVSYVSADTLTETGSMDARQGGRQIYYRVQVKLESGGALDAGVRSLIQPMPGMTASISIKSGERSVLSYLTKPIIRTLSTSLGER
jgi:membrane fusion protein, adhesin transport system